MEIHNNADVLKSLLNVGSSPSTQGAQPAQAAQATQKPGTQPALGGEFPNRRGGRRGRFLA